MSALPSAAVTIEDGEITIAADLFAQKLGLSVEALKAQMRRGYVYSLGEHGVVEDAGRTRLTFRHRTRSWTVVVDPFGRTVSYLRVSVTDRGDGDPGASAGALASNPLPWWEKLTMDVSLWVRFTGIVDLTGFASKLRQFRSMAL